MIASRVVHPRLFRDTIADDTRKPPDGFLTPQVPLPFRRRSRRGRRGSGNSGAPTLWGLFIFAAMFLGQVAVIVYFVLRQGGSFDVAEAIRVVGGGLTISLSVILGLPAVLLATWIAIRPTRTSFTDYLALRWTSWRNFFIGVAALVILVGGWDLLSRALGREVTPGFMGDVLKSAQADGALWLLVIAFCVAAPMWEEIFSRGFLYRGWSESRLGVAGAIFLSSLAWTSLHLQYDWFFFGEVFSIGLLLGYLRYRTNSTWLTIVLHGLNNLAATIQTFWLAGSRASNIASQRDRDRHRRTRRQNGLQRDDLRQQRRVAAHLARQHIGAGCGGHRRADRDDGEVGAGDAEPQRQRDRDHRHQHQLEEHRDEAARLGRNRPSRCRPAPVTSRPMASEERPSASATSCQSLGSGMCVTLSASPIAQAQISGLLATVMTIDAAERFSGEA